MDDKTDRVMISILDRYIGAVVAKSTFVVLMILLALFSFTEFVGELDEVGRGSYGVLEAALYVLLTLPRWAYELFPTMALMGSMVGLGMMASNSELIIVRAAGVSLAGVVLSVMKVGLLLVVIATSLGEVVAPVSEHYAQTMRAAAMADKQTFKTGDSFWARDGDDFIHINELYADGSIGDISIYKMGPEHRLLMLTEAKRATYQQGQWVLEGIVRSRIGEDGVTTTRQANATWASLLNPQLLGIVTVEPEFLSAWGLYRYIQYLKDNGLHADRYVQAFWKKIVSPLSTAVMVFLAIPFIFGPLRSVPVGQRILVGTLVGIGFYAVDQTTSFVGLVYHFNPVITVFLPTLVFFAVGLVLVRRIR